MAVLSQKELIEAIKEWCERRRLPFTEDIRIKGHLVKGSVTQNPANPDYEFYAQIHGVDLPKKKRGR